MKGRSGVVCSKSFLLCWCHYLLSQKYKTFEKEIGVHNRPIIFVIDLRGACICDYAPHTDAQLQ